MKKMIFMLVVLVMAMAMVGTAQACNRSCECCINGAGKCSCGTSGVGYITVADPDTSTTDVDDTNTTADEELLAEFTPSGWAGASLHPTRVTTNTVTQCDELVAVGDFGSAGPEDDGGKVEFTTFVVLRDFGGAGLIYQAYPNDQEVELFSGGHFVMPTEDKSIAEADGVEKLFYDGEILHIYTSDAESVQDSGLRWVVWHDADTGAALQWDEESERYVVLQ